MPLYFLCSKNKSSQTGGGVHFQTNQVPCALIRKQLTEGWLLVQFGRVKSKGVWRVLSAADIGDSRQEAIDFNAEVSDADVRKGRVT